MASGKDCIFSWGEGIPKIFPQHAIPASHKRQEKAVVQTHTAGCGWMTAAADLNVCLCIILCYMV